ncbi:hypothetical protein GGR88_000152 [Sphingomonas jejuensis]|uniref:Uncharacterized protein n=1 Tax=Sphingomonas jejuensis TaxID=904715 RepID=A0ABX0XHP4_9SPHN|nr:hypothetical protein [Sphingomonas jejuensis]NJC32678.1 hypothetical protein [Sphingomonas jejuensis]
MIVKSHHNQGRIAVFDARSTVALSAEGIGRALRQVYREDRSTLPADLKRSLDRLM